MKGAVLHGPRDVRFEEREAPKIEKPTDAVIRISATCVCGSDLWPYRGIQPVAQPTAMGHEYCGIVEEMGSAVKLVRPGQFVIGSFFASDNTRPPASTGSLWARRRPRYCACRLRTARWWAGWGGGADRASYDADVSTAPPIIPYGGFAPVRLEGWRFR